MAAPLMMRAPIFRQHRLGAAATACGWPGTGPLSFFEALRADLTVVNDLPSFYTEYPLPEGFEITGPVFANERMPGQAAGELDTAVAATLRRDGRPAILVTMGSSGTAELLLEAIRALVGPGLAPSAWNVVVWWSWRRRRCAPSNGPGRQQGRVLVFW